MSAPDALMGRECQGRVHAGWFPMHEESLRKIERTFDEEPTRRKAVAALVTVCRVANLEGSATFVRPIASLARDMGYTYRHALQALHLLAEIGLIAITDQHVAGSKERAPSRYTLLPIEKKQTGQRNSNNSLNNDPIHAPNKGGAP
jgi:hypothetical protein